jgi:AraC-like DNA-binding protein
LIYLQSAAFFESEEFLFYIAPYTISSNEIIEQHSHEFFELVYVIEGSGSHIYQEKIFSIHEGDVFIIEPEKIHGFEVGNNEYLKVYNLLFQPKFLKKEIESLSYLESFISFFYVEPFLRETVHFKDHLTLRYHQQTEIMILLQKIVQEYNRKENGYQILIKTRMLELFILLSRYYENATTQKIINECEYTEIIEQICKFITCHYNRPLSLEQVSKLSGMSKSNFTSKFRQIVGQTFIEYRNKIRINAAKKLLAHTNEKIIYIAAEVGFEDISHFNRTFKDYTNMSPSKYRNRYWKNS